MDKEDFAFIGCRLLALYWAVKALYSVSSVVTSWTAWKANVVESSSEMAGIVYFGLVPLALYALVAFIFWFGAARIVRFLLPASGTKGKGDAITLFQVQSVAFASVGILILLSSLPEICGVLYKINQLKQMDSHARASFDTQAQVFELSFRLLLGVLLLFGSKGLSGLLTRLREAG